MERDLRGEVFGGAHGGVRRLGFRPALRGVLDVEPQPAHLRVRLEELLRELGRRRLQATKGHGHVGVERRERALRVLEAAPRVGKLERDLGQRALLLLLRAPSRLERHVLGFRGFLVARPGGRVACVGGTLPCLVEALAVPLDQEPLAFERGAELALARPERTDAPARRLEAAQERLALVLGGAFDDAIAMHASVVEETPNSVNARISLLTSLQLAGRIDAMTPHARWLFDAAPDDPRSLRYGVQVGVWGGAPDLAEAAYARLEQVDPRQADAARRFIDYPPPRPPDR